MKKKKVLVLGGGGRESAIVLKLVGDPAVKKIYCAPGNAQTAMCARNVENVEIDINNNTEALWFVIKNEIDFVPFKEFNMYEEEADKLAPHDKDVQYFALALSYGDAAIWSDEKAFKKQSKVRVFNTDDVIDLLLSKLGNVI